MGERDEKLEAIYNHANLAKHMHTGFNTKTRYGWLGGGRIIPGGVFKADIRARPDLYICANCRQPFTITADNVFCSNCSQGQLVALSQGKPAPKKAKPMPQVVKEPEELPPPPDLTTGVDPTLTIPPERYPITRFDFGGTRHDFIIGILKENDIVFADQATELGVDGLVKIKGIGQKTAEDILAAIENA